MAPCRPELSRYRRSHGGMRVRVGQRARPLIRSCASCMRRQRLPSSLPFPSSDPQSIFPLRSSLSLSPSLPLSLVVHSSLVSLRRRLKEALSVGRLLCSLSLVASLHPPPPASPATVQSKRGRRARVSPRKKNEHQNNQRTKGVWAQVECEQ